jgi:hypothetical protein
MTLKFVLLWFKRLAPKQQREVLRALLGAAGFSRTQARAIVANFLKEQP